MRKNRQAGFSLMELVVALVIIGVLASLGFKKYLDFADKAKYIKAQDTLNTVHMGLDQYYLKHGRFPDLTSYESMVDANSPLVKENLIPVNEPAKDPWEQPFEGTSSKTNYTLRCAGDPKGDPDRPPFTVEPGKLESTSGSAAGTTQPAQGSQP
jgi:prepilin-type N-terminal cleavage/methylation domain-containing protein